MINGNDLKDAISLILFTVLIFNAPELIQKYGQMIGQWTN
tara:strand:- start:332 stop:451 length:120 start_codon:yes stop_codon:yes gene_type:complete